MPVLTIPGLIDGFQMLIGYSEIVGLWEMGPSSGK
jgi:uncharacterized membrane protein